MDDPNEIMTTATPTKPRRRRALMGALAFAGLLAVGAIGTGVVFESISADVEIPALVDYVRSTGYATTLFRGGASAKTVEHLLAVSAQAERHGVPLDAARRFIPAVIVGLGKLGGRELTTGSDLDLFVTFGGAGEEATDGRAPVDAHTFYSGAVERLASALGDITPAGVAFAVDLRLRPGSKGSGFASGIEALERYYAEHGDLWERQSEDARLRAEQVG